MMDRALLHRDEVKDMPSFSLGFTQDMGTNIWDGVKGIACEYGGHSGASCHDPANVNVDGFQSPTGAVHEQDPTASRTSNTLAPNIASVPSDAPRRCPRKGKDVVRDQHTAVSSPPVVREYLAVLREDEPPVIVNEVTTRLWIDKDIIMRP